MVNTFVVCSELVQNAKYIDRLRLCKQRLECVQIINTLEGRTIGYQNHPAVLMWKGYVSGLKYYTNCIIQEWIARGYQNNIPLYDITDYVLPDWVSWTQLHDSHKAALIRKDPVYYSGNLILSNQKFMDVGYLWPTKVTNINEFTFDMCDKIGMGAPASYRWTKDDVTKWLLDKTVNPKTGRKIKSSGSIFNDLTKACQIYKMNINS